MPDPVTGDATLLERMEVIETFIARLETMYAGLATEADVAEVQGSMQDKINLLGTSIESTRDDVNTTIEKLSLARTAVLTAASEEFAIASDPDDIVHSRGFNPILQVLNASGDDVTASVTVTHLDTDTVRVAGLASGTLVIP